MLRGYEGKVMTYDGENRPLSVTKDNAVKTEYVYGADGARLKKIVTQIGSGAQKETLYLGKVEIREPDTANQKVLLYPHPNIRVVNNEVSYMFRDQLESVRLIVGTDQQRDERSFYKPFGEEREIEHPGSDAQETIGFIGERFDESAGLQYLNARYYDPKMGLFVQPDWFEVMEPGVGTNRYAYSANDPVNMLDPGGNKGWMATAVDSILSRLGKNVDDVAKAAADKTFTSQMARFREQGIREAKREEIELVRKTGAGSRRWSPKELESLRRGKFPAGYIGHHINNVAHHPRQAGNPNNIEFVTKTVHDRRHSKGTQVPTTGEHIDRSALAEAAGQQISASPRGLMSYDDVIQATKQAAQTGTRKSVVIERLNNGLNALPPDPITLYLDYINRRGMFRIHCKGNCT